MSLKIPLLIILGTTLSFAAILGLMSVLLVPDPPPPARSVASFPPNKESARLRPAQSAKADPSSPASAPRLPPSPTIEQPGADPPRRAAENPPEDRASREIEQLKKDLGRQLSELKKERDSMLSALAAELTALPPARGAAHIAQLDDETASLVLVRMPRPQRRAVLEKMEKKQGERLRRQVQGLAASHKK
jgi:hypothetical protein